VALPAPPPGARVGMSATVAAAPAADAGLVLLPLTALLRDGDSAAVWVVDTKAARVAKRPVTVGQYREDGATIVAGLAAGETVVAAGVHKLREGQAVRLPAAAR
ncbi:MAG TPA: efflux RND transporter periplasmic adaptor subunit, partial [Usitatibacteraceae bacterium]|nr:efflux RND transporter periplasmic adaptor subunit [Usitatibacteraceae bacterium]